MGDLNFIQGDGQERWLRQLDKGICSRLNQDVGSVRDTSETDFTERNVNINTLILASIRDLLSEGLEFTVQARSAASFFLLGLKFFLVTVAVLTTTVTCFVELHLGGFTIELNVARLSLSNHDWCLKVHVDQDDEFVITGLEEKMLDIAE